MTVSMIFPDSKIDDPFWVAGQLIAICAIGIMIYFGYKHVNKGDRDGGVKIKVQKL